MRFDFDTEDGPQFIEAGTKPNLFDTFFYWNLWSRGFTHYDKIDTGLATPTQQKDFFRWHWHKADEVRVCRSAQMDCIFSFDTSNAGIIKVRVRANDWIIIPAGVIHRFEGKGVFTRHYQNKEGWEPVYLDRYS